jgi:hypothetical protein
MRQFITWRFWLSLVALVVLTGGLIVLTRDDAPPVALPADLQPVEREIDLVGLVFLAQADAGFTIIDGRTTERLLIRIDGFRYVDIVRGTPGENRCDALDQLAGCVIVADLLGNAVLWFSMLPSEPRNVVTLPAVVELREGSRALLANGWVVRHAETIRRNCETDTSSLGDFIEQFGTSSTSTFSIDEQQLTAVTCTAPAVT